MMALRTYTYFQCNGVSIVNEVSKLSAFYMYTVAVWLAYSVQFCSIE